MKQFLVVVLVVLGCFGLSAQEDLFEGAITYKQSMSSDNPQMNAQLAMIGEMSTKTYFKNDKSRNELSSPMTGDVTSIIDTDLGKVLMVMNNPSLGKIYTIKPVPGSKELPEGVEIRKGDLTKNILGYECDQYFFIVKQEGTNVEMEMFATPKIKALNKETLQYLGDFDGGFPLYIKITSIVQGFKLSILQEATAVSEEQVDDSLFDLTPPEGYKKVDNIPGM